MHYLPIHWHRARETWPPGRTSPGFHRSELEVRQTPFNKEPELEPPPAHFRQRTQREAAYLGCTVAPHSRARQGKWGTHRHSFGCRINKFKEEKSENMLPQCPLKPQINMHHHIWGKSPTHNSTYIYP